MEDSKPIEAQTRLEKSQKSPLESSGDAEQVNTIDIVVPSSQLELQNKEPEPTKEFNGPAGLEPTRYGDWESKGRCVDF